MKKKKVLLICSILLIILIIAFILYIVFIQQKVEKEGNYTGYQLILTAEYGGYSETGEDLGHGKSKKIYNISEKDVFYEQHFGGIWILNSNVESEKRQHSY